MRPLIFILILIVTCSSCKKDNTAAGEIVEIYLLKSYQTVPGKCQVDASTSVVQDTSIVGNEDILGYYKSDNQFALSDKSFQRIKALADRTPFVIVVDKQVIYYGILKPSYSSSSCSNSITMDYVGVGNKVTMNLGYAGSDINIDDQRSNPKLLATLKKQGKLR